MFLTREQILESLDLPTTVVEVPEWGGAVHVTTLSAFDRIEWEQQTFPNGEVDSKKYATALVARCVVDESGARLFTDEDIEALGRKSLRALNRVREAATKLNALTGPDVDGLEKNSDGGPAASDTSNSQ